MVKDKDFCPRFYRTERTTTQHNTTVDSETDKGGSGDTCLDGLNYWIARYPHGYSQ